jgi:hypothetical protein
LILASHSIGVRIPPETHEMTSCDIKQIMHRLFAVVASVLLLCAWHAEAIVNARVPVAFAVQAQALLRRNTFAKHSLYRRKANIILRPAAFDLDPSSLLSPSGLFTIENAAAFPFYALMALAPGWKFTQTLMRSYSPLIIASFAYAFLAYLSFNDPVALEGFSSQALDLTAITKGFSSETAVATAWAHFIMEDLFLARWVYLDSQANRTFASHSIVLCLFFGPLGFLSHVITRTVTALASGRHVRDLLTDTADRNDN